MWRNQVGVTRRVDPEGAQARTRVRWGEAGRDLARGWGKRGDGGRVEMEEEEDGVRLKDG